MIKSYLRIVILLVATCTIPIVTENVGSARQGESGPFTEASFLILVRSSALRDHPSSIVDMIRLHGIGFLPTKSIVAKITAEGVHADIINEIKKPETYTKHLMVRICQYSSPANLADEGNSFAQTLRVYLSDSKVGPNVQQKWPLLAGIPFDATVAPVDCFDQTHAKAKGTSYVTISGNIRTENGKKLADSLFTYYPLQAGTKPLGQSLSGLHVSPDGARQIVDEAMTRLENMLK